MKNIKIFEHGGVQGTSANVNFPHYIKLEPSSHCTRACSFCAMRHDIPKGFMDMGMYEEILSQSALHGVKTLSYARHGEFTMHPQIMEMIQKARKRIPDVYLIGLTNGDLVRKNGVDFLTSFFEAGLNVLQLDLYDEKVREFYLSKVKGNPKVEDRIQIKDYYIDDINPWSASQKGKKILIVVDETSSFNSGNKRTRDFNTQGSSVPFSEIGFGKKELSRFPYKSTCKELHKYLTILWNGETTICCVSPGGLYTLGNVKKQTVQEIWQSERAEKIRFLLSHGRRDAIPVCYACNRCSFRDGLWPYWGERDDYSISELAEEVEKETTYSAALWNNLEELDRQFPIQNRFIRRTIRNQK